ncbi:P-loop containing nucleoside triphosphate hydrolase protein, partial [Mycena vulgaris]
MLPAQPKIFHGRDPELDEIIGVLMQESARIAILGPGGMGKSSLAKAALHHPQTAGKYQNRFFVACDSAITSGYLMDLIGEHIGLKPGKDLTKPVTEYFASSPPCLLVLDNLETIWEPIESRRSVEELLSVLTDISHLALVITMRGAERPANVRWTHPFLQPLKPLSDYAAQQAFIDVAEDFHDTEDVRQLLSFTDNLPLAVNLMAHLVDYEGCDNVLARWDRDRTTMLSSGSDKQSNLDKSINISLSSPRMTYGARDLLSLLSILPDGLSDIEL